MAKVVGTSIVYKIYKWYKGHLIAPKKARGEDLFDEYATMEEAMQAITDQQSWQSFVILPTTQPEIDYEAQ